MPRALIQSGYDAVHQTQPRLLWVCDHPNGLIHASMTGLAMVYSILLRRTVFMFIPTFRRREQTQERTMSPRVNISVTALKDMDGAHAK